MMIWSGPRGSTFRSLAMVKFHFAMVKFYFAMVKFHFTMVNFILQWLNFILQWLNFILQWLNFILQWLNFILQWLNFILQWLNFILQWFIFIAVIRGWNLCNMYASPSSGDAYSDRQLTLNFELWVQFFVCRNVSIMRIPESCLSVRTPWKKSS